ncbi:MAG: hypothetical protein GTO41_20255 [Burkholderiales bacterium]|nr:hypothetical protein [Burkholderiales bacterium]
MRLSRISRFFFLLSVIAAPALADDGLAREDGVRLLAACRVAMDVVNGNGVDPLARADAALCIGFVEGFLWGHGWKSWRTGEDMYFCPPQGFGYRQAVPVVVSYLESHSERLIQRAHLLLFSALSSTFPCTQ